MSQFDSNLDPFGSAIGSQEGSDQSQKAPSSGSSDINIDDFETVDVDQLPKDTSQGQQPFGFSSDVLPSSGDISTSAATMDDKLLDFDTFTDVPKSEPLSGVTIPSGAGMNDMFDPLVEMDSAIGLTDPDDLMMSGDNSPNNQQFGMGMGLMDPNPPVLPIIKDPILSTDSFLLDSSPPFKDSIEQTFKEPLKEPTPPPKEPTPPPKEPTPPPKEPTPPPKEPTPPPKEPTPPPKEPTPPPKEPTPPPKEPTSPPKEPTPPPKEPTPPPKESTPPPKEPTPPPKEPTPPPKEPTPPPKEPTPPPRSKAKEPSPVIKAVKAVVQESKVSCSKEVQASLAIFDPRAWFHPDQLDPRVVTLIYWHDVKKTGVVFGSIILLLLSLAYLSLISVIAYSSLTLLTGTICFRIYKNIMQAIQKSTDGHPFREYLELDTNLPGNKVHEVTDVIVCQVNSLVSELKRLFLVEDLVDSVKFGSLLWCLTYVGSWFNGLTLVILSVVALFSLPKVYEQNQAQIDQYVGLVRSQVNDIMTKVKAAIPIGNKEKTQ